MAEPLFSVTDYRPAAPPSRRLQTLNLETRYWRSFSNSELASGLFLPVPHLAFSPAAPHDLAAAASAAIHLYHGANLAPKPFHLSSFSDLAYSPSFRCDGALLAAGGESGLVQIFTVDKSRPALRRLRAHSRPVHLVRYPHLSDKLHVFSGGDDAMLSYWDVSFDKQLISFPGAHKDYIRAGCPSPISSDVIATGSYDHTVKLWDVRGSGSNPLSSFDHGDPVESLLFLPSGGLIATAGGNCVKIWDVIGGGRLIHTMESHNKTVTSLCLGRTGGESSESRLLSVSIDGYMKVFDFMSFKITHSMRYPNQLLSVGFSPTGKACVVGTSNGVIYVGKKKEKKDEEMEIDDVFGGPVAKPEKQALRPSNFRYFHRGQGEKPQESDFVIKRAKKVKLAEHDKLLKKFMHKDALVSTLKSKNPNSIVAVMEELVARKKLIKCVENLDSDELGLLLGFLNKYATMPRYAKFLMGLAKKVLELRAEDVLASEELRGHVRNLRRMVVQEMMIQQTLQEIQGMISPLRVIADGKISSRVAKIRVYRAMECAPVSMSNFRSFNGENRI